MVQSLVSGVDERIEKWLPSVGDSGFRIWMSPQLPNFGIVSARDHSHEYPAHLHDCVELIWLHAGSAVIQCRNKSYDMKAGEICMLAPNELHSTRVPASDRCTFTIIHAPSNLYWPLVYTNIGKGNLSVLEPARVLRLRDVGVSLPALMEELVRARNAEQLQAPFTEFLDKALQVKQKSAQIKPEKAFFHPAVLRARIAMSASFDEEKNVSDMANEVGLNMRYFISLFKNDTGLSPHQYQIALRVERARNMLQELDAPLCDVAISAGFSDQSHLNRHFKRSYGYTPGTFRQILNPI